MTEYKVLTNSEEVNDIFRGDKRYIVRRYRDNWKVGDILKFQLVKHEKEIFHQINCKTYVVTKIEDWSDIPIYKYWKIISFREVETA